MLKRINFAFKPKPTPALRDPPTQVPQLTPYVQVAPRNPLFQNSNILTGPTQHYTASAPLPESTPQYGYSRSQLPYAPRAAPPPPPLTELPFSQSHRSVVRHVSERSREDEMITLPPYDKDLSLGKLQLCIHLYCTVLYCIVYTRTVLYCIHLYCIVLYTPVLPYCIVYICTVLYCIHLYCTVYTCTTVLCQTSLSTVT